VSLEARQISVTIGRARLLDQVSLCLEAGRLIAVLGANGAGKSTLLKALSGDIAISAGAVLLDGKALSEWRPIEMARRRAVLPQDSTLNFPFSAFEVVLMGRMPHCKGIEGERDRQIAYAALERVGVAELARRSYITLSGGERQRVQLARVLAQIWEGGEQTRFLLLDEPTASLDLAHQHSTLVAARQFAQQGVGVLAILHDLNLAARYADHVLILKAGRVLAEGTPQATLTAEIIEAAFETPVVVIPHPKFDCPLIVPIPSGEDASPA
jgi:iron complex transport system ATP-binding protein